MSYEAKSRCQVCGARVHVNAGSPTPALQPDGVTGAATQCDGTGQPSR